MSPFKSLRFRFAFWTASILLIVLVAFGVYMYESVARELNASVDSALALNASQVISALNLENGQLINPESGVTQVEAPDLFELGISFRIISQDGRVLQSFGPFKSLPVPTTSAVQNSFYTTYTDSITLKPLRVYTAPVTENGRLIALVQVVRDLTNEQRALLRLRSILWFSAPMLALGAGLGGYLLALRALAPIDKITRMARRISAEDLSSRLNLPLIDDEVGRLASTFDEMLARLDESFRREKQFIADASHDLRTPLTAICAIISMILEKRRTSEEYEQALKDLWEETDRLQTLTESLLQLVRAESSKNQMFEPVDLSTLLRDLCESYEPMAEVKSLKMAIDVPEGLISNGDRDSLIRLFANLLDNAIKYTVKGRITLSAFQERDGMIKVVVSDTGMGIAPEHLPHVFERFYRVDKSRSEPGTGLGLSIAAEIALAHRGKIGVKSIVGQGTSFIVFLPQKTVSK